MTDHGLIIATLLVGVVGVGVGVGNFIYQRKQAIITEKDYTGRTTEHLSDTEWNARTERVVRQLLRINPSMAVQEPREKRTIYLYAEIFPDVKFQRSLTETVIALDKTNTRFERRDLQQHELKSEHLRQVVARAEAHIHDFFQVKHPDIPRYLGD